MSYFTTVLFCLAQSMEKSAALMLGLLLAGSDGVRLGILDSRQSLLLCHSVLSLVLETHECTF